MPQQTLDDVLRTKKVEYLRLTLDQVEVINKKRSQYIFVYFSWFLLQIYILYLLNSQPQWTTRVTVLTAIASVALVFFYWRFVSVLRMMGFAWYLWISLCVLAAMPIPGFLVVAYIDRLISKSLVKGYQQRDALLAAQREAASPDVNDRVE